jgi:cation diffusion facilitator CzcD-associated flavoprotein CzcO
VIDASGTWTQPNPAGADGLPALGERAATDALTYRVPDLTDPTVAQQYAGRHVVVVGSGYSALTVVHELAELARTAPGTRVS